MARRKRRPYFKLLPGRRNQPRITQIDVDQGIEGETSGSIEFIFRFAMDSVFAGSFCLRIIRAQPRYPRFKCVDPAKDKTLYPLTCCTTIRCNACPV